MKFAFAILCHKNVEQINFLIDALTHNFKEDDIYIHLDKNSTLSYDDIKSGPNIYFVTERIACKWGHISLVQATIELFKMICRSNIQYDYIWQISGQDFPIKQRDDMVRFLQDNYDMQFIPGQKASKKYMRRVQYCYPDLLFNGRWMTKIYFRIYVRYNIIFKKRKSLPEDIDIYKGSYWITITPAFAEYAVQMFEDSKFIEIFRTSYIPDELFFPTIAYNSQFKESICSNGFRMVDWTWYWNKPFDRPHVFTTQDYERIVASDKFFARKFDMNIDKEIILKLRAKIEFAEK